ncbi:MAG: hypothetical protein JW867_07460, partial [Candidatus Omnitrophica bacterium]|nr:hypothetical protein [Candidatus Omnitrophota bacterium]
MLEFFWLKSADLKPKTIAVKKIKLINKIKSDEFSALISSIFLEWIKINSSSLIGMAAGEKHL